MDNSLLGNIFDLNVKTVIGILFWGNLLIAILIFVFYSIYKNTDTRKDFFIYGFSKLTQGTAWFLFLARNFIPDWFSINMANIFLFASFYLESLVLLSILRKDTRRNTDIQRVIFLVSLIIFNMVQIFLPYRYTITAASFISFSIFVIPTFYYLSSRNSNRFHLIFGLTYFLFLVLLLARSAYPFFNPDAHIFSNDLIQRGTFLAILILLLFSGTGLLLLILMESNEKIKQAKTELEQANVAIKESEIRFRSYFELPLVGITITSPEKGWLEVNAELCDMLGYSLEELKKLTWADLTFPADLETDLVQFERLLSGEIKSYTLEKRFVRKSGELIWTNLSVGCVRRRDNSVDYTVALLQDITKRKQMELQLQESEQRFRDMMEQVHLCSAMLDKQANITFANDYFLQLTGWEREEVLGRSWFDLFIPPQASVRIDLFKELDAGTVPLHYENEILIRTGERRLVSWNNTVLRDAFGNIEGIAGIGVDITERKRAEEALKESEASLLELNATKDKFFSIIAHDLRTPFSSIISFSNYLLEQVNEKNYEGIEEFAGIIQTSSQHAMSLLMNLLEWSRSQTGRMDFCPEFFDIVTLCNEVVGLLNASAIHKSIRILPKYSGKTTIVADRSMISTVLRNLISNAIKFTNPMGEIIISVEQNEKEMIVSVADNGVGIKTSVLHKLFRIDESYSTTGTNNEQGTGLGLILCKEFIEKHNGKIWVESELGKGSKFCFSIPNG